MHEKINVGPRGRAWQAVLVILALAVLPASLAAQEEEDAAPAPLALITKIQLRKESGRLQLHFILTAPARYEVVGNPRRRVIVVKFHDAMPGFPGGRLQFAFNDPFVEGIVFETIDGRTTWAKIRLRIPNIEYELLPGFPEDAPALALREAAPRPRIELAAVRLGRHAGGSRVVLDMDRVPEYEVRQVQDFYLIRLIGVQPGRNLRVGGEDERVALLGAESDGDDTLVRVQIKQPSQATPLTLSDPARLVFDFAPVDLTAGPAPAGLLAEPARPRGPPPENLEELMAEVDDPVAKANYILAERAFRTGDFRQASRLFRRVYDTIPETRLGMRSFFRSTDSVYEALLEEKATNFHGLIVNYQAAIRAAESTGYQSELIPRAFFHIGRGYQRMGFQYEADVHYEILQDRFPHNRPYAVDSHYYRAQTFLETSRYEEAVAHFREFLELEGEPSLEGPAFYHIGDARYNQGDYREARKEFNRARRISPNYPNDYPLLMFHMGETYYENAEFDNARQIYANLMGRYPDKPYTKLVALRLGDFLLEEGKEEDALAAYRLVVANAPLRIEQRGKMRIANIFANRPTGDEYRQALTLYDEIIARAETVPILQEAYLRKALVLTLHNRYQEAIDAFESLRKEFPDSPYLLPNFYQSNIDENLKGLVDDHYRAGRYWEVAKVYTRYRDRYFDDFQFKVTLFQVASAYHVLGLYDEALALYRELERDADHSVVPLARYRTALAQIEKDDLEQAEDNLLRFIEEYEQEKYLVDARMQLGRVYDLGRRYEDALNAYRLVIADYQKTEADDLSEAVSEAYYRSGDVYKELGQLKNAADAFRDAVENFHHPIQGDAVPEYIILSHYLVGDMLSELGQDEEALQNYQDAIARYPEHERTPWAWFQMGLIHRRRGEDALALETFNTLVDLAKSRPGELWESLAKDNQRELVNVLQFQEYLNQ